MQSPDTTLFSDRFMGNFPIAGRSCSIPFIIRLSAPCFFCRWQIKWMGLCGCIGLTHWTHFLLPIFTDLCFLPLVGQRARSQRKVRELDEKIFGAILTKSMNTYYLWHSEKARKMTAKRTNEIHGKKEAPHWFAWVGNVCPDVFILV